MLANLAGARRGTSGRSAERADDNTSDSTATLATTGGGALLHDRRSHSAGIL